jgi:hypothetical protein
LSRGFSGSAAALKPFSSSSSKAASKTEDENEQENEDDIVIQRFSNEL